MTAGACYGIDVVPKRWRETLHMSAESEQMAYALFEANR